MWSVWHNAVTAHSLQAKINPSIDIRCNCCTTCSDEMPIYGFYNCPCALEVWKYIQTIFIHLTGEQPLMGPHVQLYSTLCIFGSTNPQKYLGLQTIWSLLHGSSIWLIWITRNNRVFSQTQWPRSLFQQAL